MKIVVIDIDSLRPDYLGAYGHVVNISPWIDELAAEDVRFDAAYVVNSPCMPSQAAVLTGRYGLGNRIETHGPAVNG